MSGKEINIDWDKYLRTGKFEEKKVPLKPGDSVTFKDSEGNDIIGRIIQKADRTILQVLDLEGRVYVIDQDSVEAK
jgi:hypothetical protein